MRHVCRGLRSLRACRSKGVLLALAAAGGVAGSAASARADLMVSVDANLTDRVDVLPGGSFDVRVSVRTAGGASRFNSAIFQVLLGAEGVVLEAYDWASPFATGSIFDDSTPASMSLPLAITEGTLSGPGYSPGAIDFELSNVAESDAMQVSESASALVALRFRLPADWAGPGNFTIAASPDTFADGFDVSAAVSDSMLTVRVIPAPAVGCLLLVVPCAAMRRRRATPRVAM